MTNIYISSKGEEKLISELPYPYLKSALAKLEASGDERRMPEIIAMRERKAQLEAEYEAQQAAAATPGEAHD